jgi:hypothetical protein
LLLKHTGVLGNETTGLEVVCRGCKKTNHLFGTSSRDVALDLMASGPSNIHLVRDSA